MVTGVLQGGGENHRPHATTALGVPRVGGHNDCGMLHLGKTQQLRGCCRGRVCGVQAAAVLFLGGMGGGPNTPAEHHPLHTGVSSRGGGC